LVGVTAFANRESVFLDLPSTVGLAGPDAARWGNDAISLHYEATLGKTRIDATSAASRYHAELPVPASAAERAAGRTAPTLASGRTDRFRGTLDASRPIGDHDGLPRATLRFG